MAKQYQLMNADGTAYLSAEAGAYGGHRRTRIYGRLDCRGALLWIGKGHYIKHRVFFRDAETAREAGYRPCSVCLPDDYTRWRSASADV